MYICICICIYICIYDLTYGKQAGLLPTGEMVLSIGQNNWAKAQVRSTCRTGTKISNFRY